MLPTLSERLSDDPFQGYAYAYPHKTAYRHFPQPIPLKSIWQDEHRDALFLYAHLPFCEMRCGFCNLFTTTNPAVGLVPPSASMFVDVGAAASRTRVSRSSPGSYVQTSALRLAPHLGVGLRREVGTRTDLGVRLELDRIDDHTLIAVRALDYRYRLGPTLAVTAFAGAARLDLATPAYGYYVGGGLQWRDVRPGWDAGLDVRYGDKLARDELQPGGVLLGNVDSFNDAYSASLYLSRRF